MNVLADPYSGFVKNSVRLRFELNCLMLVRDPLASLPSGGGLAVFDDAGEVEGQAFGEAEAMRLIAWHYYVASDLTWWQAFDALVRACPSQDPRNLCAMLARLDRLCDKHGELRPANV